LIKERLICPTACPALPLADRCAHVETSSTRKKKKKKNGKIKKKKEDDVNYLIQQLSVADLRIIVELYLYWTSSVCPPPSLFTFHRICLLHTLSCTLVYTQQLLLLSLTPIKSRLLPTMKGQDPSDYADLLHFIIALHFSKNSRRQRDISLIIFPPSQKSKHCRWFPMSFCFAFHRKLLKKKKKKWIAFTFL
jgi:hypothetical protein